MIKPTSKLLQILLGIAGLHILWWAVALIVDAPVLPEPYKVYAHLPVPLEQEMPKHLLTSLWRITQGIIYSLGLALGLALLIFRFRRLGNTLEAFVYLSYPIPKLALLPVAMLLLGLGEATKITMIVLIILFQLVVGLRDSLRSVARDHIAIVRSLGVGFGGEFKHVLLPAILPDLLSALRIAIGTAISVLFVTETYGTSLGMGYYIIDSWMRVDYLDMYAGIVMLGVMGFVLFILVDLLEWVLCPHRREL